MLNKAVQGIQIFIEYARTFKGDETTRCRCSVIGLFKPGPKGYKEPVPLLRSVCAAKKTAQSAQILSEPIIGDGSR